MPHLAFKLFTRKNIYFPTFFGWGVLLVILGFFVVLSVRYVHDFLAVNQPLEAQVMVVEGWMPDYALEASAAMFKEKDYRLLLTTGAVLSTGSYLSRYKSYAELAQASLEKMGLPSAQIKAFPSPEVMKYRTYMSAVTLNKWLSKHPEIKAVNIMTLGPHARRTRYLFEKAFSKSRAIGIIAMRPEDYVPEQWWHSSEGIRTVMSELIFYIYYRFFWHIPNELADIDSTPPYTSSTPTRGTPTV